MEKLDNFALALKELRNSKGITLDQISDSTKIKVAYLEKLESGDFSFKPDIYIKLFLKEYLKYVDLDKYESILQEFDNIFSRSPNIDLTFLPYQENEDSEIADNILLTKDYDPKKIGTILIIMIIVIAIYQFFEYVIN
tara:strand:- start:833 stop:1246 length:414 start_codon:yes stop_codon:yes gene_type:complete